jgi:peptidoglycan/LPS O-acetylase OafA/YrhL
MRSAHLPVVCQPPVAAVAPGSPSGSYLGSLDLFRVIACAAVVGNHSFIWANMSTNVIGTGFVTMLHLSRNAFFFLSGLVICYSQITHPRSWPAFWKRRYVQLGVPYLAWTAIYLVFTLVTISLSWAEAGSFLRQNLLMGYSQLYPAFVIFQFVLIFPLLLKLLRSTTRHGLIMAASLAFALALGVTLHYPSLFPVATDVWRALGSVIPWSRDLLTYQEFFVAGALVALHFDRVYQFAFRQYRRIFVASGAVGALMVLWYIIEIRSGSSLLGASDPYEAEAVIWYCAAIAAIFTACVWNEQRRRRSGDGRPRRSWATSSGLAALTGGVWLSHNLFLTSLRAVLGATGLRATFPWELTVATLFVGTVALSASFVALVLRTRFRWVLGGPLRSAQRASYAPPQAIPRTALSPGPSGESHRPRN